MDWYLEGSDPAALSLLRRETRAYLERHGDADSDLDAAELLFGEAVGNALRHTSGPIWISLTWAEERPTLMVYDLGPGFDARMLDEAETQRARVVSQFEAGAESGAEGPGGGVLEPDLDAVPESGVGLFLLHSLSPEARAAARSGPGMVVSVVLPVTRQPVVSHDPPRHRSGVLPALSEANPGGGFGKEAFLRALVVQLSQAVEIAQGPDAAEAAVAQVGIDVGGQMEEEFRRARDIVGRMSAEQMGECYVRLKRAINGDFYVIEATEQRIVLGNNRCPFGEAVKRSPALCRMTSSVFGGIAARNSDDGAAVVLEERIALGDPGCRVVVYLGEPPEAARGHAHVYATPVTPDPLARSATSVESDVSAP